MERQYMTLGYFSGFDALFNPTLEVMDFLKNPIWGNTKLIRQLVKEKQLASENDLVGITNLLKQEEILHSDGMLLEGISMQRALNEHSLVDLPLYDDEKRFAMAWNTINKLIVIDGQLKRDVKLPIGMFEQGTPLVDVLRKLQPSFADFDIELALAEGVNLMLLNRRDNLLDAAEEDEAEEEKSAAKSNKSKS